MGLAASQARLLTITSRKSRAQFESMRMSHQKLTLSRSLTEISNEYQNSLDQTKLYYDFYGVNSTDTPLTYNLLMSPSSLNDYTPTLISNNQGQIVLSSPYAAAARAAGIPQEGLGCTPSSLMRNAFIMSLAEQGVITQGTAESICAIDYNQGAGLGGDNLVNTVTTTGSFEDLLKLLNGEGYTGNYSLNAGIMTNNGPRGVGAVYIEGNTMYNFNEAEARGCSTGAASGSKALSEITFADLLNPTDESNRVYLICESDDTGRFATPYSHYKGMIDVVNNVTASLGETLMSLIDGAGDAVAYANSQMQTYVSDVTRENTANLHSGYGKESNNGNVAKDAVNQDLHGHADGNRSANNFLGFINNRRTSVVFPFVNRLEAVGAIDLTDFVRAWFTYFMQYMQGLGSAASNSLHIEWGKDDTESTFADVNTLSNYEFTFTTTTVSDSDALISNFYDTLFNQICINGWTENNQVATDSSYLKEMLQSGQMYLTSMSDDYYYYQNNYATNNFVKEVSDDAAIAAAESKYTTQKARINAKEQELDLKMKNLDTEISSLETEYEAIKKVIEDNVSKSFTRYDS